MATLANIPDLPEAADTKSKPKIQTIYIAGDTVARYNEAKSQADAAAKTMEELKPTLQKAGLDHVFTHNCGNADEPKLQISSVNLCDRLPDEDKATSANITDALKEVVMFTWTRKDVACDTERVKAFFKTVVTTEDRKANINNYVAYEVAAKFDTSVFMVDGKFNQERYDAYMEALVEVSKKFKVENPLSCGKVLRPKPDFHERRFKLFDLETNLKLQQVLPTQCNLKAIRPEKT